MRPQTISEMHHGVLVGFYYRVITLSFAVAIIKHQQQCFSSQYIILHYMLHYNVRTLSVLCGVAGSIGGSNFSFYFYNLPLSLSHEGAISDRARR
jgi:hypothetical protein